MGCFGILTSWLERHQAKTPDDAANQRRKMKNVEQKIQKERTKKEKKAAARRKTVEHSSGRRHGSPPYRSLIRRTLRSPHPSRQDMAADLEESTGPDAWLSDSGIAYTFDFRPGAPARRPNRIRRNIRPPRRRCSFTIEETALMQDILRREQIIKRQEPARQQSVKRLEAERRRLATQSEKCEKVKQGETKFVESVHKRKKNLKKLAQKTLDMRVDTVLKSVRTKRAMKELERREEEEVLYENGEEGGMDNN